MIELGQFRTREGNGIGRRAFVGVGAAGILGGLPLQKALAAQEKHAKSVILLWLWGGPSHLDTFDPKPNAPAEVRGPFSSIATRTPGLRFGELFPRLAKRSDKFAIVRSNTNYTSAHEVAGSISLTGGRGGKGDSDYSPTFGSIVQRIRGSKGNLPPFIAVTQGALRTAVSFVKGAGGGRWGKTYDPFPVICNDEGKINLPDLQLLKGLNPLRLADRRQLLKQLDQANRLTDKSAPATWTTNWRRAYDLLLSEEGRKAFDLSREPQKARGKYGFTTFGQSCLLARRLVEARVPFVQVNWSRFVENIYDGRTDFGWDTHWLNFEHMTDRHGPILDRALSALLDDLDQRGLLDSTLVLAMGEFGRTPKISKNGGRDHWPKCYSSLWAGGGVEPGRIVGESDRQGLAPVTRPVTPEMVGTTLLELAGIRSDDRARLRLAGGDVIHELT